MHVLKKTHCNKIDASGNYRAAVDLKKRNPSLKVLIAVGGWAEGGKKYSKMASTPGNRSKFVKSVADFLRMHKFDGLDVDWEYPGATDRDGVYADKWVLSYIHNIYPYKIQGLTLTGPIKFAPLELSRGRLVSVGSIS